MIKVYNKSESGALLKLLRDRAENITDHIMQSVTTILANVKSKGDAALREYSEAFDGVKVDELYYSEAELEEAVSRADDALKATIDRAAENIRAFHEKQKQQSWFFQDSGRMMGQRILPLRRVGLYVPGGTAAYPSSVLMNAIPAKVAGVDEIVMATPPKNEELNPAVIYAAKVAGVGKILKAGGAQAIAALAYGTESVERVDKIVGPGNIFVAMAKKMVFGTVDIDMIAGPSEVLIIADEHANPAYVAADLMSQAEHDPLAAAILITTSKSLPDSVIAELKRQSATLKRVDIIERSLAAYGSCVVVDTLEEAAALSDAIAPEHLELAVSEPMALLGLCRNAGSVFLGEHSPEPLGDYFAGPNHVLPTNGTARFSSALSVDSFVKRSSFLCYDEKSLEAVSEDVIRFAEAEGLSAHANSIKVRFGK